MKKLALFDIDRTLAEGSIGVLCTNWLSKRKLFFNRYSNEINRAIKLNKNGKLSYKKRGEIIIKNWVEGFKGWNKEDILQEAKGYFKKEHYKRIYPGARDLMKYLKKNNYYIVGISRAFEECLIPLKNYLDVDYIVGTKFEYKRGKCTGKLLNKMWEAGAKEKELMEMFKHTNLTTEESIAFGDTEDDFYMLKFVEYPVTVNVNKTLEKIATEKHWPIYNNLKILLRDLKSGKFIPQQNWFHHYAKKYGHIIINDGMFKEAVRNDKSFIQVVKKYVKPKGKILEIGCGLGRTAINLSLNNFDVTAVDNEKDILKIAKINCYNFGKNIKLRLMDMFEIDKRYKAKSFKAVTHGGVLEHFSDNQIKIILDKQLKVAPLVIFSVPVKSKRNEKYFKNDIMGHRYLWSKTEWVNFLKNYYKIRETKIEKALRKDDLIIVVGKK